MGSERRKTVRSISTMSVEFCEGSFLVREDRNDLTSGVPVVPPGALLGSYVGT
jgi:hypothetical protein